MAFIRAAHFWTETHSDLTYEADMLALMERHPELGELLLDPAEAEHTRGAIERERALVTLREREEQFIRASCSTFYQRGFIGSATTGCWPAPAARPTSRAPGS